MSLGPSRRSAMLRDRVGGVTGWLWPTARLALAPAALLALAMTVVPVALVRLVVDGSSAPPAAVGVAVAFVVAAATAAMLADDAAHTLAPVAVSPARRALRRGLVASVTTGIMLTATAVAARCAWPGSDVVDVAAGLAIATTAGVVTALVRPTGTRDGATAAAAGTLAAAVLAAAPLVVTGAGPVGRGVETATSWWSTDPLWWTLGVLAVGAAVLRRR